MKGKCYIGHSKEDFRIDEHKLKIIYKEDGWIHGLFLKRYVRIYHLQCKRCGNVFIKELSIKCPICNKKAVNRK